MSMDEYAFGEDPYGLSDLDRPGAGMGMPGAPGTMGLGMFDPKKKMQRPMSIEEILLAQAPYGSKQRLLLEQMKIADQLRGEQQPGLRTAGRTVVAPTWTESLNAGLRQGMGGYERGRGMRDMSQLYDEGTANLQKLLEEQQRRRDQNSELGGMTG